MLGGKVKFVHSFFLGGGVTSRSVTVGLIDTSDFCVTVNKFVTRALHFLCVWLCSSV